MKTRFHIPILITTIVLLTAIGIGGCTDSCMENKNALPLAGFYESGTSQKISIRDMEVCGIGSAGDSLLLKATETTDDLWLPFRIDADTTRFVFRMMESEDISITAATDTVTFIYSRTPRFVNAECGVSYIFGMREIETTGTFIDSVVSPSGFIDNTNSENLKIYFKPTAQQ